MLRHKSCCAVRAGKTYTPYNSHWEYICQNQHDSIIVELQHGSMRFNQLSFLLLEISKSSTEENL